MAFLTLDSFDVRFLLMSAFVWENRYSLKLIGEKEFLYVVRLAFLPNSGALNTLCEYMIFLQLFGGYMGNYNPLRLLLLF